MIQSSMLLVARSSEVCEGHLHGVWVGQHCIVLTRSNGKVRAFPSACPHRKAELATGTLQGHVLTCPWHGWRFDLRNGHGLTNPHAKLELLPTEEREGNICVWLPPRLLPQTNS